MLSPLFVRDRLAVEEASALIRQHGKYAGLEAAAKAEYFREKGNHIHFARWCQIEQLIVYLSANRALSTVH